MHRIQISAIVARVCVLFGVLVLPIVSGCGESGGAKPVVIYVSADETVARGILQSFEEQTGIDVIPLFDTEATKTTGLASRLCAERDRPRADLFWSSECFRMIELDETGILAPLTGAPFDTWMEGRSGQWKGDQGTWFGFAPRARVLVYSPERLAASDVPKTWFDLADPQWANRLAMADPRFGTTSGHVGAIRAHLMDVEKGDAYEAWLAGLARNKIAVLISGNAGVVEGVASGEYDLGMTDTDDVWAARAQGLNVALVYPRHTASNEEGGGTLLVPNTVARIAGGPNPEGAQRLAAWLLSEEVEQALAASDSKNIPLRGDAGDYAVPDPLDVDLVEASRQMPSAIQEAREAFKQSEGGV